MYGERVGQSKAGQPWREWKEQWYDLLEQTVLVSSLAGMSPPGKFSSIDVADEDTKLTVWCCPKEPETR